MVSAQSVISGALGALLLAGCTPQPDASARAPVVPTPPGTPGPALPSPGDQCGATARQDWVGRSIDSLPAPPADALWRRGCSARQETDDHRPERLNIFFDEASRRITAVNCG